MTGVFVQLRVPLGPAIGQPQPVAPPAGGPDVTRHAGQVQGPGGLVAHCRAVREGESVREALGSDRAYKKDNI